VAGWVAGWQVVCTLLKPAVTVTTAMLFLLPALLIQTLEELLSLRRQVDTLKGSHDEAQQQADLLTEEAAGRDMA
jgi:hypothetical protein